MCVAFSSSSRYREKKIIMAWWHFLSKFLHGRTAPFTTGNWARTNPDLTNTNIMRPWSAWRKPPGKQMTILPFSRNCHRSLLYFQLTRKWLCCCWLRSSSLASRINLISALPHSGMAARLFWFEGIGKDYPRGCRGTKQSSMHHCLGMLFLALLAPNSLVDNIFPDKVQFQRRLHVSEQPWWDWTTRMEA